MRSETQHPNYFKIDWRQKCLYPLFLFIFAFAELWVILSTEQFIEIYNLSRYENTWSTGNASQFLNVLHLKLEAWHTL